MPVNAGAAAGVNGDWARRNVSTCRDYGQGSCGRTPIASSCQASHSAQARGLSTRMTDEKSIGSPPTHVVSRPSQQVRKIHRTIFAELLAEPPRSFRRPWGAPGMTKLRHVEQ